MPQVIDARAFYAHAYQEGFGMPAFNVCNLEMAQGVLEAAEAEEAPVILQTYAGDLAHGGLTVESTLLGVLAKKASVPVILHLDHGDGLEAAVQCLRQGFSSVMFDGSHLELKENAAQTRRVAEVAHSLSAATEGELGRFGGEHGSVTYTDPEEAESFVAESTADTLAVSVGSEHGKSSRLDLARLENIASRVHHPLVLHGGSGIHPEDVREAVSMGVVKVNIGHALSVAACEGARKATELSLDHYGMFRTIKETIREAAREKINLTRAAGRAQANAAANLLG